MWIRRYEDRDYPDVAALLRGADMFDPVWDARSNLAGMHGRVAAGDDEGAAIIGCAFMVEIGPEVALIRGLCVHADRRRQGVATALVDALAADAAGWGARQVVAMVEDGNDRAAGFWGGHWPGHGTRRFRFAWYNVPSQGE